MADELLAAVDLGSNSFRLQVARVDADQLYAMDALKETVRLAAGLSADRMLDEAAQQRGVAALERFAERLRGLPMQNVRAVATNTFRVAKNAPQFLARAETALGFPIEIIAGHEEARLIYLGVARELPPFDGERLVVDIGGGSTECIVGRGLEPIAMESLYMGCVGYSREFFEHGKITRTRLARAEAAAQAELESLSPIFTRGTSREAIGASGTARALAEILEQNGLSEGGITADGLTALRKILLDAGDIETLQLKGLQADRIPVIGGGFAIMSAVFRHLRIERMSVAATALREGVLYDLFGRLHDMDSRETTVHSFMQRYSVDAAQAERVEQLALALLPQLAGALQRPMETSRRELRWAAKLHEIGISIAHSGYHKHSAYIVENADMPGFSRAEQNRLAALIRGHRGSVLKAAQHPDFNLLAPEIFVLRLATLLHRARVDGVVPPLALAWNETQVRVGVSSSWLRDNPWTQTLLEAETAQWAKIDRAVVFVPQAGASTANDWV